MTEDVLQAVLDAFNRHDLDAILEHFADDAVFESPRGPEPFGTRFVGKGEVRGCDLWTFRDGKIVVKDSYWKRVE
jgi:ketosteroid isomerase-like protein